MRSWIIAFVLGSIAIAPILFVVYDKSPLSQKAPDIPALATVEFKQKPKSYELEAGAEFEVRACKVIDGYRFGLFLEGDNWIEAHLPYATKEEASTSVVEWLNKAEPPPPTVVLRRNAGDHWIVDLYLTVDGQRRSVVDLLEEKDLLLKL